MSHHTPGSIFVFLLEMGFHHVGQAGFELLTSGDLPALATQSAGITGVSHEPPRPAMCFIKCIHLGHPHTIKIKNFFNMPKCSFVFSQPILHPLEASIFHFFFTID